jgi:hypothetical protein
VKHNISHASDLDSIKTVGGTTKTIPDGPYLPAEPAVPGTPEPLDLTVQAGGVGGRGATSVEASGKRREQIGGL